MKRATGATPIKKLQTRAAINSMVIDITNHKGGCGKTAITEALATELAMQGYRVMVIDLDPQCNYTRRHGIFETDAEDSRADELFRNLTKRNYNDKVDSLPLHIIYPKYFISGGMIGLIAGSPDCELYALTARSSLGIEECSRRINMIVGFYKQYFDFIIIDTPPSLYNSAINELAINVSDRIIVPFDASEAVLGLKDFMEWLRKTTVSTRPSPIFALTKYQPDTVDIRRAHKIPDDEKLTGENRSSVYRIMREVMPDYVCVNGIQELQIYRSHTYLGLHKGQRAKYKALIEEIVHRLKDPVGNSMDYWFENDVSAQILDKLKPIELSRNRGIEPTIGNFHFWKKQR